MGNTIKKTFEVPGYTTHGGSYIQPMPFFHRYPVFTAGGYDWSISYYPKSKYCLDSIDLCLQLESKGAKVKISSSVALLNPASGLLQSKLVEQSPPMELDYDDENRRTVTHWVPKSKVCMIPAQGKRDGLVLEWSITILKVEPPFPMPMPMPMPETEPVVAMPVPMWMQQLEEPLEVPVPEQELEEPVGAMPVPMWMQQQEEPVVVPLPEPELEEPVVAMPTMPMWMQQRYGVPVPELELEEPVAVPLPEPEPEPERMPKLQVPATNLAPVPDVSATTDVVPARAAKAPVATDVTYSVGGELFDAHKVVLSMRSPVFKSELSGAPPSATIDVDDMRPDVFEALLHYIYTDTLPTATATECSQDDEDASEVMCQLLMAAERYDVEGLKLLCEEKLCTMLDVDNVADMLAFADDQYCSALKDACVDFMVTSGRMEKVVASHGYQRLRMKYPFVLVDVFEKSLITFPKV